MADLPELPLFEEIQGISNSSGQFCQDEHNKVWYSYEEESSAESKTDQWQSSSPRPTYTSKVSSPTRDTWDPMLWNINLTTYVDLHLQQVQVRKRPILETPLRSGAALEGVVSNGLQAVLGLEQARCNTRARQDHGIKARHCRESFTQLRKMPGSESCLQKKVK